MKKKNGNPRKMTSCGNNHQFQIYSIETYNKDQGTVLINFLSGSFPDPLTLEMMHNNLGKMNH